MKKSDMEKQETISRERYIEGVGRRKTAVARVRIEKGSGKFIVNEKAPAEYFGLARLRETALSPLVSLKMEHQLNVSVHVKGGGVNAQAEAIRHGLARALVSMNEELKNRMRELGFLTRDPRMVERKKYGLKKARRAPQWAKR